MTVALLDDHLLRDLLADDIGPGLGNVLRCHDPASHPLGRSHWTSPTRPLLGDQETQKARSGRCGERV